MAEDLCAVILQADCLTLEDTTVIGAFLSMHYFILLSTIQSQAISVILSKYNLSHIWDRVLFNPQDLNWAVPNSLVHKHNLGSKS